MRSPPRDRTLAPGLGGALKSGHVLLALVLLGILSAPPSPASAQTLREIRRIAASANDLSGVGVAAVGADGAIWFEQYEDGVIAGFAPNATNKQIIGRKGEGPGDLRTVKQILVRPNEIWVVDETLMRGTSFDPSGKVNSTVRFVPPQGLKGPRLFAAAPAGVTWWMSMSPDGRASFAAVPRNDAPPLARLGFSLEECIVGRGTKAGSMAIMVPFCHHGSFAFSPNGEFAAEALPLPLAEGGIGVRVVVVSVQGDTVLNRQLSLAPSPIPKAVRDSAIGSRLRGGSPLTKEVMQEMSDRDLIPRIYPPVVDLRVSDTGEVVVDVVSGEAAERRLAVFRRSSREVSMLPTTSTRTLRWFGGNRLLLTDEDEDGLEDIVLYEIMAKR